MMELMKMETSINWNNRGSANSIKDALTEIKHGNDIGWEGTKALMPKYDDFHHWMHFAFLLTSIHNRDCSPKKYSIIRIECNLLQFYILVLEEEVGGYTLYRVYFRISE